MRNQINILNVSVRKFAFMHKFKKKENRKRYRSTLILAWLIIHKELNPKD